jgi:hypothetical protein
MSIVQLYYKELFKRLHWIWFVTGTSHNHGVYKLFPKYFGINHVIVWLDDIHFVQLCNSYELPIDTFVKTYDNYFQSRGCWLWCVWTLHVIDAMNMYFFVILSYIICMYDVLHHLIMFNFWNDKWYHTMHQWNVIIQNKITPFPACYE